MGNSVLEKQAFSVSFSFRNFALSNHDLQKRQYPGSPTNDSLDDGYFSLQFTMADSVHHTFQTFNFSLFPAIPGLDLVLNTTMPGGFYMGLRRYHMVQTCLFLSVLKRNTVLGKLDMFVLVCSVSI